jgi:hypothetical protein
VPTGPFKETIMETLTHTRRSGQLRTALSWLPTFLGFPLGGLAAKLIVGPVDSITPAIIGGAITGAVLGGAQWLALRRRGLSPMPWIAATTVGLAIGLGAGAHVVDYATTTTALATQGALCGLVLGLAQGLVLKGQLGRIAWAWPAALAVLWALGWTITASAGIDVERHYTVFGSSGAIAVTVVTAVLPVMLSHRSRRSAR